MFDVRSLASTYIVYFTKKYWSLYKKKHTWVFFFCCSLPVFCLDDIYTNTPNTAPKSTIFICTGTRIELPCVYVVPHIDGWQNGSWSCMRTDCSTVLCCVRLLATCFSFRLSVDVKSCVRFRFGFVCAFVRRQREVALFIHSLPKSESNSNWNQQSCIKEIGQLYRMFDVIQAPMCAHEKYFVVRSVMLSKMTFGKLWRKKNVDFPSVLSPIPSVFRCSFGFFRFSSAFFSYSFHSVACLLQR